MARADVQGFDVGSAGAMAATPDGLLQLGMQYAIGRGVCRCEISAHKWFNLAALRGNADAKIYRAEIASEMSKSQIAEAQRQARDWLRKN